MANTTYDNESYLQSLAAARGDADRQITNTLAEIARQRDVAYGQADQIGGVAQAQFDAAGGQFNAGLAGVQSGIGSAVPAEMMRGRQFGIGGVGTLEGLQAGAASYGRAAGLLHQGFDERSRTQTSSANNIGSQIRSDFDMKRNEYVARREEEDRATWRAAEEANRQRALAEAQMQQSAGLFNQGLTAQGQMAADQRAFDAWQAQLMRAHLATLASPPPPTYVPQKGATGSTAYKAPLTPLKGIY